MSLKWACRVKSSRPERDSGRRKDTQTADFTGVDRVGHDDRGAGGVRGDRGQPGLGRPAPVPGSGSGCGHVPTVGDDLVLTADVDDFGGTARPTTGDAVQLHGVEQRTHDHLGTTERKLQLFAVELQDPDEHRLGGHAHGTLEGNGVRAQRHVHSDPRAQLPVTARHQRQRSRGLRHPWRRWQRVGERLLPGRVGVDGQCVHDLHAQRGSGAACLIGVKTLAVTGTITLGSAANQGNLAVMGSQGPVSSIPLGDYLSSSDPSGLADFGASTGTHPTYATEYLNKTGGWSAMDSARGSHSPGRGRATASSSAFPSCPGRARWPTGRRGTTTPTSPSWPRTS